MLSLSSFGRPVSALVVGANGAIGGALVAQLASSADVERVWACSRSLTSHTDPKITPLAMDLLDEASLAAAVSQIPRIDLAIVATGRLHGAGVQQPEKSWRALDQDALLQAFAINAIGPALVAKHVLPLFPREGKAVFAALSARVGSISDNRLGGWYGYRASKAALNQFIRSFSIELGRQRKDAICVALHPGTVESALSRPFLSNVREEKLFTPAFAAERLLSVINGLVPAQTGELVAWDGSIIAP